MNLSDVFASPLATMEATSAGSIFIVRCEPDRFTGERLNVGVFGVDRAGRRHARMVQAPGRLECLYGEAASNVVWLAKTAGDAALAGVAAPSPQLFFDGPIPYRNSTLEEAVSQAFNEYVTVALAQPPSATPDKLTDEEAQNQVSNAIKSLIGLDFELLAGTPQILLQTDKGPWPVYIPLQPRHGAGTIRSTAYSPATLKTHLMDSLLDLECAARYGKKRSTGLFLLRPPSEDRRTARSIDAVIDNVAHRAPPTLHFDVAQSPEALARRIHEWAKPLGEGAH
jgi:hypothetical protein